MDGIRKVLVLTLVVALLGLTGVAHGQALRNPDTYVVVRFGDPESLDPAYAYDTASSEITLWHIYETLIFFTVDVRSITFPQLLQAYRESKLPMWVLGWAADFPDADNFVTPFLHSAGTYSNAQGYKNPEVDKLVEEARFETDQAKRRAMYAKLHEIAYNDVPALYSYRVNFHVMRTWVRGWYHNPAFFAPYIYPMSKAQ